MAEDAHGRVWCPARRVLAACFGLSAGFAAIAVNALLAASAFPQRLLALFILAVAAAPLLAARSKAVLTPDSVVVRNLFVTHHVPLGQISYITNYSRGSVHIKTVSGQTIHVYAVNTPTLAVMFGRRSRAMRAARSATPPRPARPDRKDGHDGRWRDRPIGLHLPHLARSSGEGRHSRLISP
jgi:hypothetical protein